MDPAARLHKFARRLAVEIGRGKTPRLPQETSDLLALHPELALASLESLANQLALDAPEQALASAYELLLGLQLLNIRLAAENGSEQAEQLLHEIDNQIAELLRSGVLNAQSGMLFASVFRDARLPVGEATRAAFEEQLDADTPLEVDPGEVDTLLREVVRESGSNPFGIAQSLGDATQPAPAALRGLLFERLAVADDPSAREAAALMILDEDGEIRQLVGDILRRHAATLSPVSLRRLIAVRKWLPEDERAPIDEAVRSARASRIEIAPAPAPPPRAEVLASSIDGSDARSFFIALPSGKKRVLASILLKGGVGVTDAWVTPPSSRREINGLIAETRESIPLRAVDRAYLDRCVGHALAAGLEAATVPPLALLQVTEEIGGEAWTPAALDWRAELDRLRRSASPSLPVQQVIETSDDWGMAEGLADSWFEDDPRIATLRPRGKRVPEARVGEVLEKFFEPRKLKWAERFLWVALWLEAGGDADAAARFALLAHEIAEGRPIGSMPLMRELALTSIAVAQD